MATTAKKTATKATAKAGEKKLNKRMQACLRTQGVFDKGAEKLVTNL